MDKYTADRLAECQTETERQNVLAFIRIEKKRQNVKTLEELDAIVVRLVELGLEEEAFAVRVAADSRFRSW